MPVPRLFRVIVPVGDIEAAASFYSHVLGDPGRRISPGRHYFGCSGTILACFDPRADGDPWDARPNPDHLYLAVSDLEDALARVRAEPHSVVHRWASAASTAASLSETSSVLSTSVRCLRRVCCDACL